MPNLRDVNWLTPVNLGHSFNRGRLCWLLSLPNIQGQIWRDLMAHYDGTLTNTSGTVTSGFVPGTSRSGGYGSLAFDGVDDTVVVPASMIGALAGSRTATMAAWFYPTGNFTAFQCLFDASSDGTSVNRMLSIFLGSAINHLFVCMAGDSGQDITLTESWILNTWQRVVVTWDGNTYRVYRNGRQVGTAANGAQPGFSSCSWIIGGNPSTGGAAYPGFQDDLSVWSRVLSAAEVKADYELPRLGYQGVLNYGLAMMRRFWALGGTAWTQNLTESFSLTDSRVAQGNKALDETLSLTDARVLLATHALLETLSISDLRTLLVGKVLSDSFAITDNRASSATKALSDALILTDARAIGAEKTLAESVPLVEARSMDAAHVLSESLAVTDSLAESLGFFETLAETLALSDARASAAQKTLSEALAISDARASDAAKQLSETLSLSDVLDSLLAHFAAISEALTLTETRAAMAAKTLTETLALSEALDATTALLKALSETLTFTDTRGASVQKALSEPLVLSDAREVLVQKSLLDSLLLTDSLTQVRGIVAALTETFSLTDTLTALRGLFAALTETIPLTDSRLTQMGKSLSEALALTDSKSAGAARALAQILDIEDARVFDVGKPLSESLTLSDLVTGSTILFAILTETLILTDTRESSANKTLAERFDLEEAIAFGLAKHLEETLALADMTRILRGVLRLLTDIQSGVSTQDALLAVLDAFAAARVEDEETSRVVDDSVQSDITF